MIFLFLWIGTIGQLPFFIANFTEIALVEEPGIYTIGTNHHKRTVVCVPKGAKVLIAGQIVTIQFGMMVLIGVLETVTLV